MDASNKDVLFDLTFTRYVLEGPNQGDHEWRFAFGLGCVLDGIAARLGL